MKYRVTFHPHDLHRAQSLLRAEGFPRTDWKWPVVVAEEGDRLRAAIGTKMEHNLTICGPLVIDRDLGDRAAFVAYRLGRVYDRVMAGVGVTRYYVNVEHRLAQFAYILKRLGFREDCDDGAGGIWFIKDAGRWGQVRASDHDRPVNGLKQRVG